MESLWRNLRHAFRLLAKSPGFTAVAVLTLALGIGANAAIFSVVYTALLRPLPYYQPERLVTLGEGRLQAKDNIADSQNTSHPDFVDWQKMAKSYQALAAYGFDAFTLGGNGEPKAVFATQVTPNFFATLGVKPLLGRTFLDGEDAGDGPHVTMLTYAAWRSDFCLGRWQSTQCLLKMRATSLAKVTVPVVAELCTLPMKQPTAGVVGLLIGLPSSNSSSARERSFCTAFVREMPTLY